MVRRSFAAALCGFIFSMVIAAEIEASDSGTAASCAEATAYVPEKAEAWIALSTTAMAITGDISITKDQIRFANGVTTSLRYLGSVKTSVKSGGVTFFDGLCVALYAIDAPHIPPLLQGTTICGNDGINYLAIGVSKSSDRLHIAAYERGAEPILATSHTGNLCATYNFFR